MTTREQLIAAYKKLTEAAALWILRSGRISPLRSRSWPMPWTLQSPLETVSHALAFC